MFNGLQPSRRRTKGHSSSHEPGQSSEHTSSVHSAPSQRWRPLLLVIPLRLGLTEINGVYINSLKVSS